MGTLRPIWVGLLGRADGKTMHSNDDSRWLGHSLFENCLREVYASKQKTFPKGSLRRGQTKSLGVVKTPFGRIQLSVHKDETADMHIEHNIYSGYLLRNDGTESGRCFFSTYRPIRGRGWLTDEAIFFSMDAMSQEAYDWYAILSGDGDGDLEISFNTAGLLTADEIWIDPELRGAQAWKVIYFSTMSAVFVHQRRMYEDFLFKAHPLIKADEIDKIPKDDIRNQARQLRRFYAVHLNAFVISNNGKRTHYMRAPVPDSLLRAMTVIRKGKRG